MAECRFIEVVIHEAWGLSVADATGSSDPFVVLTGTGRVPKDYKAETRVVDKCLEPKWEQHFNLPVLGKSGKSSVVQLTVFDHDQIGSNDFMGYVEVVVTQEDLGKLALEARTYEMKLGARPKKSKDLKFLKEQKGELGTLKFSLRSVMVNFKTPMGYEPCSFEVTIIGANNMQKFDRKTVEPYCTIYCTNADQVIKGDLETSVDTKSGPAPAWDERFQFYIKNQRKTVAISLTVFDAAVKPPGFLGHAEIAIPQDAMIRSLGAPLKKKVTMSIRQGNAKDEALAKKFGNQFGNIFLEVRGSAAGPPKKAPPAVSPKKAPEEKPPEDIKEADTGEEGVIVRDVPGKEETAAEEAEEEEAEPEQEPEKEDEASSVSSSSSSSSKASKSQEARGDEEEEEEGGKSEKERSPTPPQPTPPPSPPPEEVKKHKKSKKSKVPEVKEDNDSAEGPEKEEEEVTNVTQDVSEAKSKPSPPPPPPKTASEPRASESASDAGSEAAPLPSAKKSSEDRGPRTNVRKSPSPFVPPPPSPERTPEHRPQHHYYPQYGQPLSPPPHHHGPPPHGYYYPPAMMPPHYPPYHGEAFAPPPSPAREKEIIKVADVTTQTSVARPTKMPNFEEVEVKEVRRRQQGEEEAYKAAMAYGVQLGMQMAVANMQQQQYTAYQKEKEKRAREKEDRRARRAMKTRPTTSPHTRFEEDSITHEVGSPDHVDDHGSGIPNWMSTLEAPRNPPLVLTSTPPRYPPGYHGRPDHTAQPNLFTKVSTALDTIMSKISKLKPRPSTPSSQGVTPSKGTSSESRTKGLRTGASPVSDGSERPVKGTTPVMSIEQDKAMLLMHEERLKALEGGYSKMATPAPSVTSNKVLLMKHEERLKALEGGLSPAYDPDKGLLANHEERLWSLEAARKGRGAPPTYDKLLLRKHEERLKTLDATSAKTPHYSKNTQIANAVTSLREQAGELAKTQTALSAMTTNLIYHCDPSVAEWLKQMRLGHYIPHFGRCQISAAQVPFLTDAHLQSMHITDNVARLQILTKAITSPPVIVGDLEV